MRVIEKKIMDTIKAGKDGLYRLSCRDSVEISENEIKVYLWDNLIFYKSGDVICLSSCGWFSTTTKSRLNALLSVYGIRIQQKNWKWKIYTTKEGEVKNNSDFYDGIAFDIFDVKVE